MKLKSRISKLEALKPDPQTRFVAHVYDGIDRPARLNIIHEYTENEEMEFPNEAELDKFVRTEGIGEVFKIRRVITRPNDISDQK